jgi:micrococcal nuclease
MAPRPIPILQNRIIAGVLLATALVASAPSAYRDPTPGLQGTAGPATASAPAAPRQMIPAELIRVIDGDTVELRALIWLDQHVVTRVRLRGIDAPEFDSRCPEESRRAAAASAALADLLAGRTLHLTDVSRDKYGGRVVARLLAGQHGDVGETLRLAGHARAYAGGRRERRCG